MTAAKLFPYPLAPYVSYKSTFYGSTAGLHAVCYPRWSATLYTIPHSKQNLCHVTRFILCVEVYPRVWFRLLCLCYLAEIVYINI